MSALDSVVGHLARHDLAAARADAHHLRVENQKLRSMLQHSSHGGVMADGMDMCPTVHEELAEVRRENDRLRGVADVAEALLRKTQDELKALRAMQPAGLGGDPEARSRAWSAVWAELERQGMLHVLPTDDDGGVLWTGTERAVFFIRLLGRGVQQAAADLTAARGRIEAMEAIARARDRVAEEKGRLIEEVRKLTAVASISPFTSLLTCVCCRQIYNGWSPVLCPKCIKPGVPHEQRPTAATATG